MTNEAALMGFIIFILGVPMDMFLFRIIWCLIMTCILKFVATNRKFQGSIHLSGKTSQIVHKMLQDMMLGTVEKSRVKDFKENLANPKPLRKAKDSIMFNFLKEKITETKENKFDNDEEEFRNNRNSYDIYEDKGIDTVPDGGTTTRNVLATNHMEPEGGAEENLESVGAKGMINMEPGNNSISEDLPEKNTTMKKLIGYYRTKEVPEPNAYDEYCFEEDEFFPSILDE
jgi:hypothetical protein